MNGDARSPDEDGGIPPAANPEPEPEGGPLARQEAFLEERFAPLRPRDAPPDPEAPASPALGDVDRMDQPETSLPPDFHRRLIEQYREHQQTTPDQPDPQPDQGGQPGAEDGQATAGPRPSASSPALAMGEPQAPVPAPANNWIPIGPSVLRQGQGGVKPATSGRTPAIAVAPGGTRVYIGAANGGVWRSDDTGLSWRSLMDAFDLNPTTQASDSLACGAIAIVPGTPDRIYVGSGEGAGGAYFGVGPIVSFDGGASWLTENVAPTSQPLAGTAFYALAIDPADPERVVAASRRGVYRREPNGAGGFHWAQKLLGGTTGLRVTSVVVARSSGVTTFYAAQQNGPVFTSTDGDSWSVAGAGFPASVGRISLALQENNPNVVYAQTSQGTVFRLDLADGTWRQISGVPAGYLGTQGWYDLAITVAPDNVNRVYLGGSTVLSGGDWSGSIYRCEVTVSGASVSMTSTYIGGSVHADIHALVFAPGDANKLWVGCDGGVFYSTNPTGSGNIFVSRNTGLATMTMNYLAQHPIEDAVLFSGTQDNGGVRYTGEEAWLYSSGGDGGFAVVNWHDPYKVLSTYVYGCIRRSTNGGVRYSYSGVNVPMVDANCSPLEDCLFYAPLAGTPPNPGSPADADVVAFGSIRPWISTTFGGGWQSIPTGTPAGDNLNERIRSLAFASASRLYAGTMNGGVYRFDRSGASWSRTQINTLGGANSLLLAGPVTDIAIDWADATGSSVYITFGGTGDYRHMWHFDGTQWQQRSGPAAGAMTSLLDVQANAIVVDPSNPGHIYLGADIGIWRSTDGGLSWATFSEGLPDASVLDLQLHDGRRLLRAATHGRGVFERTLDNLPKQGVELYIRDTQLDQGRFTTINFLPDPTDQGETVRHWSGPDIKLDTPDMTGQYQFPLTGTLDFLQFVDTLTDDFRNVATHAAATITTRVYVQVHNRGIDAANNVRVMLLLANASAGLPALPAGFAANVQSGTPITTPNWRTVGFATLNDVRVGFPKIAAFDLTSNLLPPPANLAGNDHHCVLALVHHADDAFTAVQTHTDTLSRTERKAAHKNLKVVQFIGTLPPTPLVIPIRISNAYLDEQLLTSLIMDLRGYGGRARIFLPPLKTEGALESLIKGMTIGQDFDEFKRWAEQQTALIRQNQRSKQRYDEQWSRQRMVDIEQAFNTGFMLDIQEPHTISLNQIVMEPDSYHTLFLMLERPPNGEVGEAYTIETLQMDDKRQEEIGALTTRIELVPEPRADAFSIKISGPYMVGQRRTIRARFFNSAGQLLTPQDGAMLGLSLENGHDQPQTLGTMRYHSGWRSFWHQIDVDPALHGRLKATALLDGLKVCESEPLAI